jgi:hypothetical protein
MLQLIKKHAAEAVFPPEELAILVTAFDRAWDQVAKSGAQLGSERRIEEARDALGKYIIAEARKGERDPSRLAEGALLDYAKGLRRN